MSCCTGHDLNISPITSPRWTHLVGDVCTRVSACKYGTTHVALTLDTRDAGVQERCWRVFQLHGKQDCSQIGIKAATYNIWRTSKPAKSASSPPGSVRSELEFMALERGAIKEQNSGVNRRIERMQLGPGARPVMLTRLRRYSPKPDTVIGNHNICCCSLLLSHEGHSLIRNWTPTCVRVAPVNCTTTGLYKSSTMPTSAHMTWTEERPTLSKHAARSSRSSSPIPQASRSLIFRTANIATNKM